MGGLAKLATVVFGEMYVLRNQKSEALTEQGSQLGG